MNAHATVPSRDDLARLLTARDDAKGAMSATYAAMTGSDALPLDTRLALDIDRKRALQAYCAADDAYDAALNAYIAAQQVAA